MWQYFLWGGIFVAVLVIEGLTLQLMSIWFSVGALAALISSFFDVPVAWQWVIFVAVSLILFLATRPLIRKWNHTPTIHTNADSVIGMEGIVKEEINTLEGTGRVFVNGLSWAARADTVIPEGTTVTVLSMQGVTLTVEPKVVNKPVNG